MTAAPKASSTIPAEYSSARRHRFARMRWPVFFRRFSCTICLPRGSELFPRERGEARGAPGPRVPARSAGVMGRAGVCAGLHRVAAGPGRGYWRCPRRSRRASAGGSLAPVRLQPLALGTAERPAPERGTAGGTVRAAPASVRASRQASKVTRPAVPKGSQVRRSATVTTVFTPSTLSVLSWPTAMQAVAEFVRGYREKLRKFAFWMCGDWHASEDVVQDALMAIHRR